MNQRAADGLGGGACRGVHARTYECRAPCAELHCQEVSLVVAERTRMAVMQSRAEGGGDLARVGSASRAGSSDSRVGEAAGVGCARSLRPWRAVESAAACIVGHGDLHVKISESRARSQASRCRRSSW
jgi:hypothetical protein